MYTDNDHQATIGHYHHHDNNNNYNHNNHHNQSNNHGRWLKRNILNSTQTICRNTLSSSDQRLRIVSKVYNLWFNSIYPIGFLNTILFSKFYLYRSNAHSCHFSNGKGIRNHCILCGRHSKCNFSHAHSPR